MPVIHENPLDNTKDTHLTLDFHTRRKLDMLVKEGYCRNWSEGVRKAVDDALNAVAGPQLKAAEILMRKEELTQDESAYLQEYGRPPEVILAERQKAQAQQNQRVMEATLALEKKVHGFLKRKDPAYSSTLDWFTNAWYGDLKAQGWAGSPIEVMQSLLAKGKAMGWD